ncbi:sulfotransferase [Nitrosococcus oceani]|nr:sulfotransferase [Nitrosococcus oceani]
MSKTSVHPLLSSGIINYARLLNAYGFDMRHLPRVLGLGLGILAREPVSWIAAARYHRRVERQEIAPDPLFIVGHWRSGTTHLQNLLNCDPQFSCVTLLQAGMPREYLLLSEGVKRWLGRLLPSTRLMDNVSIAADVPWEEELALAAASRYSFYHVSFFPRSMERIFDEAVMFDSVPQAAIRKWWTGYLRFLQMVQYDQPGRRLLLKNPANTARIRLLKKRFPKAQFIHIHRNPYKVFVSSVHLYLQAQNAWGLQSTDRQRVVAHVLASYPQLMRAYFEQREVLAETDLAEVSFASLQKAPLETLESIYCRLDLTGFEEAVPRFRAYLERQKGYRKNRLELTESERAAVATCWRDIFTGLGYEM